MVSVASFLWRSAVLALGEMASVVIIDVSAPSDNLLWELETVVVRRRVPYVLIMDGGTRRPWFNAGGGREDETANLIAEALSGREVLTYQAGELHDFAAVLHDHLVAAVVPPAVSPTDVGPMTGDPNDREV